MSFDGEETDKEKLFELLRCLIFILDHIAGELGELESVWEWPTSDFTLQIWKPQQSQGEPRGEGDQGYKL